ncbi:hypothetical protein WG936_09055 [Corynebacterium sp. H127]|uniref:hypothetical protein n=1 Tax=Corynebacterium sp. H127 TaxID=3133418 RepID=UPI0030A9B663
MSWHDQVLNPEVSTAKENAPARQAGAHTEQHHSETNGTREPERATYVSQELEMFTQCVALRAGDVVVLGKELGERDFFSTHARTLWGHVQRVARWQVDSGEGGTVLAKMAVLESLQASGEWVIGNPLEQLWLNAQHAHPTTLFAARRVAAGLRRMRALHGAEVLGRSLVEASTGTVEHVSVALESVPHLRGLLKRIEAGENL